jgi:hypothetical protein
MVCIRPVISAWRRPISPSRRSSSSACSSARIAASIRARRPEVFLGADRRLDSRPPPRGERRQGADEAQEREPAETDEQVEGGDPEIAETEENIVHAVRLP